MMGGNPTAANPTMTATTGTKTADPTQMASMGQMGTGVNATAQYSGNMSAGYGTEAYGQAGYGYNPMQGDYGANAGYMGYNNTAQQGGVDRNMQGGQQAKYGGIPMQATSPSQMSGYPKQGQSEIGPIKGKIINYKEVFLIFVNRWSKETRTRIKILSTLLKGEKRIIRFVPKSNFRLFLVFGNN